jgi:hypothetical protein
VTASGSLQLKLQVLSPSPMVQTDDTLAEINGIKPNVLLGEGDEDEVKGSV